MNYFKIFKRIRFIRKLKHNILKTETSIELIHQTFLKPYNKRKAYELDRKSFLLCVYIKTLNKLEKW